MKKRDSNLYPLLSGIILGGAAIYFLKSEKGQQMIDLALKQTESVRKTIADNSKEIISTSQDAIDRALETSKESLTELAEGARKTATNKLDELERGINIAKDKIAKAPK
mgnify:CR=1 FL=1